MNIGIVNCVFAFSINKMLIHTLKVRGKLLSLGRKASKINDVDFVQSKKRLQ